MMPGPATIKPNMGDRAQPALSIAMPVGEMSDEQIEHELATNEATRQTLKANPALAPRPNDDSEHDQESARYAGVAALLNRHYELKRERERRKIAADQPTEATSEDARA